MFPDRQPLTEDEVIAAVKAIKLTHPDIKPEVFDTYMRVVKERVLPKGMYFGHITSWSTEYGRFQVDWKDLCLEGRVATEQERKEMLSKMPSGMKRWRVKYGSAASAIGFRARFVSVADASRGQVVVTTSLWSNQMLQRTAASRRGCNRCVSWPPSLSLGRWADRKNSHQAGSHHADLHRSQNGMQVTIVTGEVISTPKTRPRRRRPQKGTTF
jgi:hypothetical protein